MEREEMNHGEEVVQRARALWREASAWVTTAGLELYVKASLRTRVSRDLDDAADSVEVSHAIETGLAVRVIRAGDTHAGFAATSGCDAVAARWAVSTAHTSGSQVAAPMPESLPVEAERWDFDAAAALPTEASLRSALLARSGVRWVEVGTTLEVLIGAAGWLAARRRHRVWAFLESEAKLVARRGFQGWETLLDTPEPDVLGRASQPKSEHFTLGPDAAAPLVAALVDRFHRAEPQECRRLGPAWSISDQPVRAEGLSGGSFDDSGFPTRPTPLAEGGVWVGHVAGLGTHKRPSFRDAPQESTSNLVMPGCESDPQPSGTAVFDRCRVIRNSSRIWVLELEAVGKAGARGQRVWIRTDPESLAAACRRRVGEARVTSQGPIVPALVLSGLASL